MLLGNIMTPPSWGAELNVDLCHSRLRGISSWNLSDLMFAYERLLVESRSLVFQRSGERTVPIITLGDPSSVGNEHGQASTEGKPPETQIASLSSVIPGTYDPSTCHIFVWI